MQTNPTLTHCDVGDMARNTSEWEMPGKSKGDRGQAAERESDWGRPTTREPNLRSTQAHTTCYLSNANARHAGMLEDCSLLSRMLEGCSLLSRTALRASMPRKPQNGGCPGWSTKTEARRQKRRANGGAPRQGSQTSDETREKSNAHASHVGVLEDCSLLSRMQEDCSLLSRTALRAH